MVLLCRVLWSCQCLLRAVVHVSLRSARLLWSWNNYDNQLLFWGPMHTQKERKCILLDSETDLICSVVASALAEPWL